MSKIFIYGTGNMAWALVNELKRIGLNLSGVVGNKLGNAKLFSKETKIPYYIDITKVSTEGDIIFLAVKDDALAILNQKLRLPGRIVLHTSGSVDLITINDISKFTGVFYPLQRVIKYESVDFSNVPICLEHNSTIVLKTIKKIAGLMSSSVFELNSEQRRMTHLAAVFVNNFANYMLVIGSDILKLNKIPPQILDGLIAQTFLNISLTDAEKKQTGPARRSDLKIIKKHLEILSDRPDIELIYKLISFEIIKRYNSDKTD